VTFEKWKGKYLKYLPIAFTEQGVAMLASILKSESAIKMNIAKLKDSANTDSIIQNWLKNRITIELLGFWELMYYPVFKTPRIRGVLKTGRIMETSAMKQA
jgi:hypothetical protein